MCYKTGQFYLLLTDIGERLDRQGKALYNSAAVVQRVSPAGEFVTGFKKEERNDAMKKTGGVLLAALAWCVVAGYAQALEFSADMISKAKGRAMQGKIYVKNDRSRMEMQGMPQYTIVRQDLKKTWSVMPGQKTYMEMAYQEADLPRDKMQGETSRKAVGSERIDGHPATKYEVTIKQGKNMTKTYQWIATDINVPIKTAAADGSWEMEYRNIRVGSPPASLFELPAGFKKMAMPAMPRGMTPGKMGN